MINDGVDVECKNDDPLKNSWNNKLFKIIQHKAT